MDKGIILKYLNKKIVLTNKKGFLYTGEILEIYETSLTFQHKDKEIAFDFENIIEIREDEQHG